MLEHLKEIDGELRQLPEQLVPLETQVGRGHEILSQFEKNNPLKLPLATLLGKADRNHLENLGWLAGHAGFDGPSVANGVAAFLAKAAGKAPSPSSPSTSTYESLLGEFVRVEGGSATPGSVEGAFLRAVVGEPWRALDSRVRNHVLAALTADAESQTRWLPDPKAHVFEAEGRTLAGENAGAFGSYFIASVLVAIGVRQYRLPLPSRAFSLLGNTLGVVLEDSIFKRLSARFLETAGNAERGRAFVTIAYVHLVRAMLLGSYEREHKKLTDAVGSAEGALATGRKRFDHLREARTEIVVQTAGIIGVIAMLLAVVGYLVWSWMQG